MKKTNIIIEVQSYLQVEVCFGIRKQLQFGEQMLLTGNLQELGKWSLPLVLHSNETNSFHSINLTLPRNCKVCVGKWIDALRLLIWFNILS